MIAADSSSLIAFLSGEEGADVADIQRALSQANLVLPPVVLMEVLSDPKAKESIVAFIMALPLLEIEEGFWLRAGRIRQTMLSLRLKARLGDALVAQSCIDHDVPLITRDKDFRHYVKQCGLRLYA